MTNHYLYILEKWPNSFYIRVYADHSLLGVKSRKFGPYADVEDANRALPLIRESYQKICSMYGFKYEEHTTAF